MSCVVYLWRKLWDLRSKQRIDHPVRPCRDLWRCFGTKRWAMFSPNGVQSVVLFSPIRHDAFVRSSFLTHVIYWVWSQNVIISENTSILSGLGLGFFTDRKKTTPNWRKLTLPVEGFAELMRITVCVYGNPHVAFQFRELWKSEDGSTCTFKRNVFRFNVQLQCDSLFKIRAADPGGEISRGFEGFGGSFYQPRIGENVSFGFITLSTMVLCVNVRFQKCSFLPIRGVLLITRTTWAFTKYDMYILL